MATVLDHSMVSPPPGIASEISIPLLFFDMLWYNEHICQHILFYESNFSKNQFLDSIVPDLKHSLSLFQVNFLPVAGKIVHPFRPGSRPVVQFLPGRDSISLTICEANEDNFNHLTGNHPRDCADFYPFVPQLPPPIRTSDSIQVPIVAVQVTLFPGKGVAFGITCNHIFMDGNTIVSTLCAWAHITSKKPNKIKELKPLLQEANLMPSFDRAPFVDIQNLDSTCWGMVSTRPDTLPIPLWKPPAEEVRYTFVLKRDEIIKLKNLVTEKHSGDLTFLSSFSVACGLVWFCLAKSAAAAGVEVADDEPEYFSFMADCRGHPSISPPLPRNYCGNSLVNFWETLKHGELKHDNGFVTAATFISEMIGTTVFNENGILHGTEEALPVLLAGEPIKRLLWVVGSPKFDMYAADFGWGKPIKTEVQLINATMSMSLSKSRWIEGGLEIGLSKPREEMEAFIDVYKNFMLRLNNNKTFTSAL